MKKVIFLFIFSLGINWLYGQFGMPGGGQSKPTITGKISGSVVDSKTNEGLEFASVSLSRKGGTKILNGAISDAKGNFKIENVSPGIYVITISFLGYKNFVFDSVRTTAEKPDYNLGKAALKSSDVTLDEVVVEGEKDIIENKIDKIVYHADKDVTTAGGDATEVLKKVPMVSVDQDGNVQMNGSSNVKVLINGKPSGIMASSVADALKMINAEEIKSVEVMTTPSAKYDGEGTSGIINIITKRKNMEGLTGSVNLSAGNKNNNLNASLNAKKGRLAVNSNLGGNFYFTRKGTTSFHREDYIGDQTRVLNQEGTFIPKRGGANANVGADYDFNAFNNLSTNVRLSAFGFDRETKVDNYFIDPNFGTQTYQRTGTNPILNKNVDWNVDYKRTYDKSEREFTSSFQISQTFAESDYTLEQNSASQLFFQKERSFNDATNREITLQSDYTHPLGKIVTIETGGKGIIRRINSETLFEDFNTGNTAFEIDTSKSNNFKYTQDVYAGYAVVNMTFKHKFTVKPGLRYEHTGISGEFSSGNVQKASNAYQNFLPSLTLAYQAKNMSNLKLSYSQRIQRPSLFYLNPTVNSSDPKNITFGNPKLSPEIAHLVELGFSKFTMKNAGTVNVFYRRTQDVIQSFTSIDSAGVSSTTYDNIGMSQNIGLSFYGQLKPYRKLTLRGYANIFYVEAEGIHQNKEYFNKDIQNTVTLNATWEFPKGFTAEVFGLINSPRVTLQGTQPSFSMTTMGVKKELWQKKGSLGISIYNPFKANLDFRTELAEENVFQQVSVFSVPFRSIAINFSYRFGKMEFKNPMEFGKDKGGIKNDDLKKGEGGEF